MKIADYVQKCREELDWTQHDLAQALYIWNDEFFGGIDTATISKWERGVTAPPMPRLQALIHFFQERSGLSVPCMELKDEESVTAELIGVDVAKVLGRPRQIVAQSPLEIDFSRGFRLESLRGHPRASDILELSALIIDASNPKFSRVSAQTLDRWMEYPANLFQVLSYKGSILGLLFTLRLKPESFDEILIFQRRREELTHEDFQSEEEPASLYFLAYYALSPQVGTALLARLYAHMIAHQRTLREFGLVSPIPEAHRIAENMGLRQSATIESDPGPLLAYRGDLSTVLASPPVLKSLFRK